MNRARARVFYGNLAPLGFGGCLGGCSRIQSALSPQGVEAERIGVLFWGTTILLAIVLLATATVAIVAASGNARVRGLIATERFVVGAGLAFPVICLSALLAWSVSVMAERPAGGDSPIRIRVIGEQWWWRVIYRLPDGTEFESANELRIPVGQPVPLTLETADVIHSFWVPNLAGKIDMIPGRKNALTLHATAAGISRGQCAEYCGGPHAWMAFHVVALDADAFARWLEDERGPAPAAGATGHETFVRIGCGACHRVRGLPGADGRIGPDLTHVAGRLSIGAGRLGSDAAAIASWITGNQHLKPANRMPAYRILETDELAALAGFVAGLR
ncbi:MAG: c-type cytochrome [Alphaproteobacteria bacterium]